MIKRNSPTQIPDLNELKHILALESQRRVPVEKMDSNQSLADFTVLFQLLEILDIYYELDDFINSDTDLDYYLPYSTNLITEIVLKIIRFAENNTLSDELKLRLSYIYSYLSEDDSKVIFESQEKYDLACTYPAQPTPILDLDSLS